MLDGEKNLIEYAVRGEASAFGSLYDHYHPKIYRFVLIKVGRREEAEDLTHQVFLSAWLNIGTYRDFGYPFSSWLYQIARNQVIDFYRTRKQDLSIEEVDPEYFAQAADHQSTVDQNLKLEKVKRAIRALKPEYQDVVLMRFVEDLSLREVAAALQKTEGAVKLMQHRAMRQLKNALGAE